MNDFEHINELKLELPESCLCSKLPALAHQSNQHLLIIRTYINGCTERLKRSTLDSEQLTDVFKKISYHTDEISNIVQHLL